MTNQEVALRNVVESSVAEFQDPIVLQQVELAVPEGVSARRLLRVAATAVSKNPDLAKPALRASLLQATIELAPTGLMPDGKEAAFVVFGNKIVPMVMVLGLRKIAAEYGWAIIAAVVHENDSFDPDPESARANYRPVRLGQDPGKAIGAYAVGTHKDGRRLLEVMSLQEIEAVRATSRAKNSGPWVEWWGEMARKTVVRRLFKSLPLDPKDRERIDRVFAATGEDGIVELYGEESPQGQPRSTGDRAPINPAPQPDPQEPDQAGESGLDTHGSPAADIEGEATEIPFEGEEPPFVTERESEPTFTTGRYAGKTLDETLAAGKDGVSYLAWAYKAWKTPPLRGALDAFAEKHPEIKP